MLSTPFTFLGRPWDSALAVTCQLLVLWEEGRVIMLPYLQKEMELYVMEEEGEGMYIIEEEGEGEEVRDDEDDSVDTIEDKGEGDEVMEEESEDMEE